LHDRGYHPAEILEAWKERGWLALDADGRGYRRKLCLGGPPGWFVVIQRHALQAIDF
jgi:hypothetical protein